ncbi:MAG: HAMP domain-containing histidine kinase [Deltaproteobacteria bacterium]|nr:HAMP domain-containing histidine kinase [Deltaproteobacteria bacterium]
MRRGSIVGRVGATVAALVVLQSIALLGISIATFRSHLSVVRQDLVEEGVALARLAAEPRHEEESLEARLDRLAPLRGFAIAIYDAEGTLLHTTRTDVDVEPSLTGEVRRETRERAGRALILRGSPDVPTAALTALDARATTHGGAAFLGLFEENTVQQVARGRLYVLATLALASVLFTLLLTAWLTRRARAGLREIESVVHRMADGDLSVRLPVRSDDEVGRVVSDFNRMADALAQRLEELRRAEAHRSHMETQRSRLFAAFTHEISTPLTSVLGYLESLQMPEVEADPDTRRRYVEIAFTQARALEALSEDLATLSRLDYEGLALTRSDVGLAALASREIASFAPRAESRHVVIELHSDTEVTASVDAQRIGQVLRILLDNALRHTKERSVVHVSLGRDERGVSITLRDDGPGVPAEHLDRLGEPLHRIDDSRARNTGGRGLGLSIARGIARAHDGTLSFESPPEGGLVVTLRLPA